MIFIFCHCYWIVFTWADTGYFFRRFKLLTHLYSAPEINISSVPDIVSRSRHFVPVIRNSYRSSVYTVEIWKPTGHCDRQKMNPVGHTWNRARQWPSVISCTDVNISLVLCNIPVYCLIFVFSTHLTLIVLLPKKLLKFWNYQPNPTIVYPQNSWK